jgi:arsenate reductase (glutaredoxin)
VTPARTARADAARTNQAQGYGDAVPSVTIYHNPNCNSSTNAVAIAQELGVDAEIVNYRSRPPGADELRTIVAKLEDPPTDLVRRDALFQKLGLTDADVETVDQIIDVIVANKMIMQRPLLVTDDKAIIGRPKERVRDLLA